MPPFVLDISSLMPMLFLLLSSPIRHSNFYRILLPQRSKCYNFVLIIGTFLQIEYPSAWKLANVIPLFKNDNPQHKVNYRPVYLLASFSKICERVVFYHLYNFLMETGFLYKFQSGFRPGDSTINQLIFLVHKIYEALEDGKEVRVVFLDISKAFDKVWHAGLFNFMLFIFYFGKKARSSFICKLLVFPESSDPPKVTTPRK